jgi:hypothetical protein
MPSITAVVVPDPAYVYVETNWADVPSAVNVCVDRVVVATGERAPLRSYVSYDTDGCLALSCGVGIFWDTEAPFDTEVQYCATVTDAAGNVVTTAPPALVTATFSTVAVASWPPADTGQVFTNTGGAAADYSGTGTRGQHAVTSTGVLRVSSIPMTTPNAVARITAYPAVVALTQPTEQDLWLRADAAGANGYRARVRYGTAGTVDLILESVVAGVATSLGLAAAVFPYIAATAVAVRLSAWGSQLNATVWDLTTPQPAPQLTATSTVWTVPGVVAASSLRNAGNTNGTVNFQWDDLSVTDVCAEPVAVEVCSDTVVIENDGCFRLGDPVRPCNDRHVCLEEESDCSTEDVGVYFARMGTETYADNSGQLLPVNARRPIVVSRRRRDKASTLTLVTRTFTDRDDVLDLAEPGSPLLWRGPAGYGTGDIYMSVLDVAVDRSFLDHQEQPRVVDMPFMATDSPADPSLGVCGARVMDLCDVYASWTALVAAGLSYADLLRGLAGTGTSVALADWDDVNADFATWNALNAGEADWNDTLTGFP